MSYILSALRKAENERKTPVSESFIKVDSDVGASDSSALKDIAIVVLVVMLIACIVYLIIPKISTENSASISAAPPVKDKSFSSESRGLAFSTLSSMSQSKAVNRSRSEKQVAIGETRPVKGSVFDIETNQLGPEVMANGNGDESSFPALNITGYIYFEDAPDRSKLFIDGIVYRLNSRVRQGLVIQSFQKNSVMFSYRGRDHSIPVN